MRPPLARHSFRDISRLIRELETLNLDSASVDQIKARIQRLLDGYSCLTRLLETTLAWRARRLDTLPTHVRELWYPPPASVRTIGRLNRPGQSLMYLAASHHTALLEMRPNVGDTFCVLQVRLKDSSILPHVMELGVAEKASHHSVPRTAHILDETKLGREFLGPHSRKNLAIRSYLAREFTRVVPRGEEHMFKVSVAIADLLLDSPRIDGVEYPCMAGDPTRYGGGTNVALKPDSADRLLVPDTCWFSRIEKIDSAGYHVRCEKRARSIEADGSIRW